MKFQIWFLCKFKEIDSKWAIFYENLFSLLFFTWPFVFIFDLNTQNGLLKKKKRVFICNIKFYIVILRHNSIPFWKVLRKNCFYKDEWRDRLNETRATCDKNRTRCQLLPNQQFGNIKTERYVINSFLQVPTFFSSDVAHCCVSAFISYIHLLLYVLLLIVSTRPLSECEKLPFPMIWDSF